MPGIDVETSQIGRIPPGFTTSSGLRFRRWALALCALCALPALLMLIGMDFSSSHGLRVEELQGLTGRALAEKAHHLLRSSFIHSLLEWTAVCTALIVGLLAYLQHRLTHEASLAIIGLTLACAGLLDCFHTFAADRFMESLADEERLLSFTWMVSRTLRGVLLLIGVGIFAFSARRSIGRRGGAFVAATCFLLLLASYLLMHASASSSSLPRTIFPGALIRRPYDMLPIIPCLLCAFVVYPRYMRRHPSAFASALSLSLIPQIVGLLYMAFGSTRLHDSAFNVAHTLKIAEYAVPLLGLVVVNMRTFQRQEHLTQELKERGAQLVGATFAAEEASRVKSAFLANVSHEIRSPMTAILGYSDLLIRQERSAAERQTDLLTIRRNGEHLLELLDDILDLSKIEAGRLQIELIRCSPVTLVEGVVSLMRVRAIEKGLYLEVEYADPIPETIETDPTRVRQILINLLGNALKFTRRGGVTVGVSMESDEGAAGGLPAQKLRLEVVDTGIGMSPQQQENLFHAFVQADSSVSRLYGGTGLGLSICSRLVEMLGGSISLRSAPRIGTEFVVRLDAGRIEGTADLATLGGHVEATPGQGPLPSGEGVGAADEPAKLGGRILFADDGGDNRRLVAFILGAVCAEVKAVENGALACEEARRAARAGRPYDLILMDMQMPQMDGLTATANLRKEGYRGPIVALTAHAMSGEREKYLAMGCTDYLAKPFKHGDLLAMVSKHLPDEARSRCGEGVQAVPSGTGERSGRPEGEEGEEPLWSVYSNDPEMVDLIQHFVGSLPSRVDALLEALDEGSYEELAIQAHDLKGTGGGYGFDPITDAAALVEEAVRSGVPDTEEIEQRVLELAAVCRRTRAGERIEDCAS
ncbi:MAG: ATP-binding protein [Planctomycetota bacterium]